jgi:hypothetical protein
MRANALASREMQRASIWLEGSFPSTVTRGSETATLDLLSSAQVVG